MTVVMSDSRRHITEFLEKNRVGVLATASDLGKPHAATIYVTFDQDLNIYFVTRKETRKSHNLHSNDRAAIAIYNAASQTTLQIEGAAIEITEPSKTQWVLGDIWHIAAHESSLNQPPPAQLMGAGDYVVYQLPAPSLRLATFSQKNTTDPNRIFHTMPSQEESHFNGFDDNVNQPRLDWP